MAATDRLIPSKRSGKDWDVTVTDTGMTAVQSGRTITVSSSEASRLEARRRWFRWPLYEDGRAAARPRGINCADAARLALLRRVLALTPEFADASYFQAAPDLSPAVAAEYRRPLDRRILPSWSNVPCAGCGPPTSTSGTRSSAAPAPPAASRSRPTR